MNCSTIANRVASRKMAGYSPTLNLAIYSKAKTKKALKEIVKNNPENPPLDMSEGARGPYGTPEEYRNYKGWTELIVTNQTQT